VCELLQRSEKQQSEEVSGEETGGEIMTRKDFKLIADTIRTLPSFSTPACGDVVRFEVIVNRFADALTSTNARFDRSRFVAASNGR
jgi:D-Tyr-tRNAtyr deacylase